MAKLTPFEIRDMVWSELHHVHPNMPLVMGHVERFLERIADLERQLAEARATIAAQITAQGWLKENGPGGWIDDLRKERDALKARVAEVERAKYGTPCSCEGWVEACSRAEERAEKAEAQLAEAQAERDALKLRMRAALNQCDTAINSAMQGNPGEYVASITNDNRNLLVENAALKAQLAAAQATIAALQWTKITPDNLPLDRDYLLYRKFQGSDVFSVGYFSPKSGWWLIDGEIMRGNSGYTHFLPIAPPAQASAKEAERAD